LRAGGTREVAADPQQWRIFDHHSLPVGRRAAPTG
jgi:hypothetical protein